jgi:DNA-binding MarR family transcriptional regulator
MPKQKKTTAPTLKGSQYKKSGASPGYLFWKVFNTWSRQLRSRLEELDLTQAQYSILAATAYLGSADKLISQQAVAQQLSMDKMMVSDVVKTLERKKLMTRKPHPADGRAMTLHLTSLGRETLKRAIPTVEAVDEDFFGKLGPESLREFIRFLTELDAP